MGELTDKAKATGNKAAGSVKSGIGDATNNKDLEAEGETQKLKGKAQHLKGSAKGAMGDDV